MATIFGSPGTPSIPYPGLANDIFAPSQKLIPFLGAGASIAGAVEPPEQTGASGPKHPYPEPALVDEIANKLGIDGPAKEFLARSINYACDMQTYQDRPRVAFDHASHKSFPPSARELADALSAMARYDSVEWPRSLLAVSSYYEFALKRENLGQALLEIFGNKHQPLPAHDFVARAARHHLRNTRRSDYLAITTNFDTLTELAFDRAHVPYCVLTIDRNDRSVNARFSPAVQAWLGYSDAEYNDMMQEQAGKYPANFTFVQRPKPVAVIYKIHGCILPIGNGKDSIILSDEDYILYLRRQNDSAGMVPAPVINLLQNKSFLFLGYSFSDWNIRGIYKSVTEHRPPGKSVQDYAVLDRLNPYESAYFTQSAIHLLLADLVTFVGQVKQEAPAGAWEDLPSLW